MTREEWPEKLQLATTARLMENGYSPERIRTLILRGRLARIGRGVYTSTATATTMAATSEGRHVLLAAAAAARGSVVVSHQSAAVLHGIDLIAEIGNVVTVTTGPGGGRNITAGIRRYTTPLSAESITSVLGIRVTTAARTVIDLARTMTFTDGVVAADSAIRNRLTSKPQLRTEVAASRGRCGVARAGRVAEFATGLSESVLESIARVVFDTHGLPAPTLQVWIPDAKGAAIGRVDFYWERYKTIAEVDGALKYADPARARSQLRRDKRLREAGYEVVHFTWQDITSRPADAATSIRAAFRAARFTARRVSLPAQPAGRARPGPSFSPPHGE